MHGAGIAGADIVRSLIKHFAVAALVAERPYDNASLILIPFVQVDFTICYAFVERSVIRISLPQRHIVTALRCRYPVRLYVSLVHDVKAHNVAKLVKLRHVGIVARSDRVHVRPLHEF